MPKPPKKTNLKKSTKSSRPKSKKGKAKSKKKGKANAEPKKVAILRVDRKIDPKKLKKKVNRARI